MMPLKHIVSKGLENIFSVILKTNVEDIESPFKERQSDTESHDPKLRNSIQTSGMIFDNNIVTSVTRCSVGLDIVNRKVIGALKM